MYIIVYVSNVSNKKIVTSLSNLLSQYRNFNRKIEYYSKYVILMPK